MIFPSNRQLRGLQILVSRAVRTKTVPLRNKRGIISFSFDDFPHSAVSNGANILSDYGLYGTFYVSGSMCGKLISDILYFSESDLATLNKAGHEIGCHTYEHVLVSELSAERLDLEMEKNAAFIAEMVPGQIACNFSYPFGDISLQQKLRLQRRFASCRTTQMGLNTSRLDLGFLLAVRLYSELIDEKTVSTLIDKAAAENAWLIFYTHDVDNIPSPFGCTPTLLEHAVKSAQRSTAEILSVRNALGAVRFGAEYS
jgi:peptidoglycan/xylan/chitin deacetylase (PgdA/CDA1 family)